MALTSFFHDRQEKRSLAWWAMMVAVAVSVALTVALFIPRLKGDEGATIESLRQQQAEQAKQRTVDVNKRLAAMGVKSGDILFYKRGDVETIFCVQKSEAGMLDATSYSNNIKTFWGNDEYVEEGVNIVPDGGIEHTTLFSRAIWELSDYYEAQEKLDPRDR